MTAASSSSSRAAEWPILQQGFRPFFLAAGLWALAAVGLWLAVLSGAVELGSAFDPIAWHAHEMVFGYGGAVLAGFLLTAIPNWTGRLPVRGRALGALAVLWLAGRIAVFASVAGPWPAAALDLAFPSALAGLVVREIVAGRSWRNLPVALGLLLFGVANALTHAEALGIAETGAFGRRFGAAVLLALIALVGGRIIPSFTTNWLKKRGADRLPTSFDRLDRIAMAATVLALAAWAAAPESAATAVLAALGAAAAAARLARWRGLATLPEPLLWSLHLGYAWLAVGLGLIAAVAVLDAPANAAWHALFTGVIGTMTVAVMTRATLGHSGRALHADFSTAAAYLLVTVSTAARLIASFTSGDQLPWLGVAGATWTAAFAIFVIRYVPILLRGRS